MNRDLNQFFTPAWAADLLVQRYFGDLQPSDNVLEPACGDGRFLMAIPPEVQAVGVEIDQAMAEAAIVHHVGKKRAGRLLDGVTHDGYPKEAP